MIDSRVKAPVVPPEQRLPLNDLVDQLRAIRQQLDQSLRKIDSYRQDAIDKLDLALDRCQQDQCGLAAAALYGALGALKWENDHPHLESHINILIGHLEAHANQAGAP